MDVISNEKRASTRQALLDAAQDLVFERGHDRISIQDITSRANVATGTYYNYFDSKGEIFEAVADELRREIAGALEETRNRIKDPAMKVAVTLKYYFVQALDNEDWNEFTRNANLGHLRLQQERQERLEDLQRGVKGGRFKLDDVHFSEQLISGMIDHVNQSIALGKIGRRSIDHAVRSILQMLGLPDMVTKAVIQTALPPIAAGRKRKQLRPVVTELSEYTVKQAELKP